MLRAAGLFALVLFCAPLLAQPTCLPVFYQYPGNSYMDTVSMGGPNLLLAIQFVVPTSFDADYCEVFTGEESGQNSIAIWDHDAALNQPGTELGVGTWSMDTNNSWQGAPISPVVPIVAGETCWFVWGPQNGAQCSVATPPASAPMGQLYRGSFDGGQSWNGPFQDPARLWKLRIYQPCVVTPTFVRGDVLGDGSANLVDVVFLLNALFVPGAAPLSCLDAADCNDDGAVNLPDVVVLLNALFVPGSPPVADPAASCDVDPTDTDVLDCQSFPACP